MFICHCGHTIIFVIIFREQVSFERTPKNVDLKLGGRGGRGSK